MARLVTFAESTFSPGLSDPGCVGLLQLARSTARKFIAWRGEEVVRPSRGSDSRWLSWFGAT